MSSSVDQLAATIAAGICAGCSSDMRTMPSHMVIARKSVAIAMAIQEELRTARSERPRREPVPMPVPVDRERSR